MLTANASLITFEVNGDSFTAGETVLVDVIINDINPDAAEFTFNTVFDDIALAFNGFTLSDDVFNTAVFGSGDLSFLNPSLVNLGAFWISELDVPGSSFTFGQISFYYVNRCNTIF